MVRIAISQVAFDATLPGNVNVENKRAPDGDVYVWLGLHVGQQLCRMGGWPRALVCA